MSAQPMALSKFGELSTLFILTEKWGAQTIPTMGDETAKLFFPASLAPRPSDAPRLALKGQGGLRLVTATAISQPKATYSVAWSISSSFQALSGILNNP